MLINVAFLIQEHNKGKNINFDRRFFMYINWILFFSLKTYVFIKQANHNWFLKIKDKAKKYKILSLFFHVY